MHVSTVSVYGNVSTGVIHEDHDGRAGRRDVYGHTKFLGEQVAIEEGRRSGVGVVVIQPTVVYGPNAPVWTTSQLRLMKKSRLGLVDEGNGLCNAVYVDDVVSALLASALAHGVCGEKLLVSGPQAVRWVDFFRAYEDMIGSASVEPLNELALKEARKRAQIEASTLSQLKRLLRAEYGGKPELIELPPVAAFRSLVRAVVPRALIERMKGGVIRPTFSVPQASQASQTSQAAIKPLHLPGKDQEAFFRARSTVQLAKAKTLTGYTPQFTLEEGMKRTKAWAGWANLV